MESSSPGEYTVARATPSPQAFGIDFDNGGPHISGVMPLEEKPWGLRAIALVCGVLLLSLATGELLVLAAYKQGWIEDSSLMQVSAVMQGFTFHLAGLLTLWLYLRASGVRLAAAFGLDREGAATTLKRGALFFLMILPLVWASNFIWRETLLVFGITPEDQDILRLVRQARTPAMRAYFVLLAVVIAPVVEESLFRGFLYPAVKRYVGTAAGLAIVALLFAVVHHNVGVFGPLVVLAVLLGLAYEVTGNLMVPITIHSLFNFCNLVMLLLFVER
jgi:membrane protease YdiL (CAAX protease family)